MAENPENNTLQTLPDPIPEETVSAPSRARHSRAALAFLLTGILLCAAAALFYFRYWVPASQYKAAEKLMQEEEYARAYGMFNTLNFRDSSEKAEACLYQVQKRNLSNTVRGSKVYLGHYEQDNVISNGKEPIEWTILDVDGTRALLISSYILDCQPYNTEISDNIWETSSLHRWLNTDFCSAAFGGDLQNLLIQDPQSGDRISLLPSGDYPREGFVNRGYGIRNYYDDYEKMKCGATAYAQGGGLYPNKSGFCTWWLRPRQETEREDYGDAVWKDGGGWLDTTTVLYNGTSPAVNTYLGVRPIIWVPLTYAPLEYGINRAEDPAPSTKTYQFYNGITDKTVLNYLQAAIYDSDFIVEGTVTSRRNYRRSGLNPSMESVYTLSDLTVLSGSCEESELKLLVPGIASAFEFEEGRRYIVIINPIRLTSHNGEGGLYQAYRIRCLLDSAHPDLIERLTAGGYPTEILKSRQEMISLIRNTEKKEPAHPEEDSGQDDEMNTDAALDFVKAALNRSSFVVEGTVLTKQTYPAGTYFRAHNDEPLDEYAIRVHEVITGDHDFINGVCFVVPADDPSTQFEIGRRYIFIIESNDSVFTPEDQVVYSCSPVVCRMPVPNPDGLIDKMIINGQQTDFLKTKKELIDLIGETIGITDHWYNPKDYYIHYVVSMEDVVRQAPVIARVIVQDIQDEPDADTQIAFCTIRVLSDVWNGDTPAVPDKPFRIRVRWGTMVKGTAYIVCLQKHVDWIDIDGNPVCLQPYSTVDIYGKQVNIYNTVYEPAAKDHWIYWTMDQWAVDKIKDALKSMQK